MKSELERLGPNFNAWFGISLVWALEMSGCQLHAHYHAAPRQEAQVEGAAADLELTPAEAGIVEFLRGGGESG